MQSNPLEEWQRLTETYGQKYDEELLELAAGSADLTEVAQQVLRDEMKKRGLDWPGAADKPPIMRGFPAERRSIPGVDLPDSEDADSEEVDRGGDPAHEYTWKTLLCECEDQAEAWQIREVLRRAGIESWAEQPGRFSQYAQLDFTNPRILVAADQLEEARAIAAQPIPQEIVDLSEIAPPEFEPPACPKCGASDPVLENAEPVNAWKCEACGNEWLELPADQNGEQAGN
jgi:hypothetical protein